MKYSFKRQLQRGRRAEKFLDSVFADRFQIKEAARNDERRGIDRFFTEYETGKKFAIQYKADKTASRTGNAFIETISVDRANIQGWAYTCQADYIFYYIDDSGPIYVIRPRDLRKKLSRWNRKYQTRSIPNKDYNTVGLLVPLDELERVAVSIVEV